jgi:hypothetical protein
MLHMFAAVLTATVVVAEPFTAVASGQGRIVGTVTLTDARGEMFDAPGVRLTLICDTTATEPQAAASDDAGLFDFGNVRPGRCSLNADMPGFGAVTANVVVRAAKTLHVDVHLDVEPLIAGTRSSRIVRCRKRSRSLSCRAPSRIKSALPSLVHRWC